MKKIIKIAFWILSVFLLLVLLAVSVFMVTRPKELVDTGTSVGLSASLFVDSQRRRNLNTRLWYPSKLAAGASLHNSNALFYGFSAIENADASDDLMPLIVLSHGSGGNLGNQAWLATALAQQGALVVAANHPGSTSRDSAPQSNIQVWHRPVDISFLIDSVLDDDVWGPRVDASRIAAVGHSLGGYTVLGVGGGVISIDAFQEYCKLFPLNPDCDFYSSADIDFTKLDKVKFEASHKDDRISAIVAIDPAYARSFVATSLAELPATLFISPVVEKDSKDDLQMGYLQAQMQSISSTASHEFLKFDGAHHFSFLPRCKPFSYYLLGALERGAQVLCAEENGVTREQVHKDATAAIQEFFRRQGILRP